MAVQLQDGNIMLNMRDNRNYGNKEINGRRICVTADLGETWVEHSTSVMHWLNLLVWQVSINIFIEETVWRSLFFYFVIPESYNKSGSHDIEGQSG